ncbi:MAG: transcription elongation factor GreA, partial [Burkholderiaceae bacterium]|nr:transcription elongation factor GreA [Burkholderiaceae bacterium]
MSTNTIPITKHGAELLKEELTRLKHVERPAVINAIAEARAQGDLSENAEYDAAKEKQAFIEGRIKELETKLSAAQIIDPALLEAEGRVVFGATVELEDLDDGLHDLPGADDHEDDRSDDGSDRRKGNWRGMGGCQRGRLPLRK